MNGRIIYLYLVFLIFLGVLIPEKLIYAQETSSFRISQTKYFSEGNSNAQSASYSDLALRYIKSQSYSSTSLFKINTFFLYSPNDDLYLEAPEFYYSRKNGNHQTWTLGRRIGEWSYLDENWNLSLAQANFRRDYIEPEVQGLMGLHYSYSSDSSNFEILLSPMSIPDQGARVVEDSGKIVSKNRWFWNPYNQVKMNGVSSSFYYKIGNINYKELLLNPVYGIRYKQYMYGKKAWVQSSFLNKPKNQLSFNLDARSSLAGSSSGPQWTYITLTPYVVRHNLLTLDLGYGQSGFQGVYSFAKDSPDGSQDESETSSRTTLYSSKYHAVDLAQSLGSKYNFKLHLGGMIREDQVVESEGNLFNTLDGFNFSGLNFKRSYKISLEGDKELRGLYFLKVRVQYLYSPSAEGEFLQLRGELQRKKSWSISMIYNQIASYNFERDNFFSTNRVNDSLSFGFKYDF